MALTIDDLREQTSAPIGDRPAILTRHMAVIGSSGAGKTTWAAGRADDTKRLLGQDSDDLLEVLCVVGESQALGRIREANPRAHVVVVNDVDDIAEVQNWLVTEVCVTGNAGWRPDLIVVDSVTEMCRMIDDRLTKGGKDDQDWGYWGKYKAACMRLVRKFRDLPNVTVIATFFDDESKDGKSRGLDMGARKSANGMAGLFDLCLWAVMVEREGGEVYALRTKPGVQSGQRLVQGKGHPVLGTWVDPSVYSPARCLHAMNTWVKGESQPVGKQDDWDATAEKIAAASKLKAKAKAKAKDKDKDKGK